MKGALHSIKTNYPFTPTAILSSPSGELALVENKPRSANAYAVGPCKIAFLKKEGFERLLGPCLDVMKRNMENYTIETGTDA